MPKSKEFVYTDDSSDEVLLSNFQYIYIKYYIILNYINNEHAYVR